MSVSHIAELEPTSISGQVIRHLALAIFWVATAFTLTMALFPHPLQVPGSRSDKVQHILAFATLAALGSIAYPSATFVKLITCLSAFGAFIEILQGIPELNRYASAADWLADTIAAGLVLAVVHWWRSKRQTR